MNQKSIIADMHVLPEIDVEFEIRRRVEFIKKVLLNSQLTHLVLGISGGIDSSTCGRLAQLAVDELNQQSDQYQFIAVRQPTARVSVNVQAGSDAIHQSTIDALTQSGLLNEDESSLDYARGNVKARMRMIAQYEIAGLLGGLVIGTDHSAENVTGFYTKHGDGACDLAPLFGLNKRQIRALADHLGAPAQLIHKVPTADLECHNPSLPDEHALGLSYDQIDDFLEGRTIDTAAANRIIDIYHRTQHKRKPIATIYD
jgi:NAD+ synthase